MDKVLITGVSSGIGYETLSAMSATQEYEILATVRKESDELRLRSQFPKIQIVRVDLADARALELQLGDHEFIKSGVDILINNAGAMAVGPAEEASPDMMRRQFEINYFASVRLIQMALPQMRIQRKGKIIQISSGFGRFAAPMLSAYCASKYAIEGFCEALRYEMIRFDVFVSLIEPGPVRTNITQNLEKSPNNIPDYQRVFGLVENLESGSGFIASAPEDIAALILKVARKDKPDLRYPIGLGHAAGFASALIPKGLNEFIFGRILG